jgi:Ni,Fe-hydrogenase I large subunit
MEAIQDETEKYNYKISREEFIAILKENNGDFQKTADAIVKKTGMPYTKQAAQARAKRLKTEDAIEKEELIKKAKEIVKHAIYQNNDAKMSLRVALSILKNPKKLT